MAVNNGTIKKLSEISFFDDVPEEDLTEIAAITTENYYEPGDIIIEENSMADAFFIIYKGKIEILKKFEDGEEVVLGVYSDGEFFGEMSILDEGPRSATARAVDPTTILQVSYQDFERVLSFAPQIAYAIMKELSNRLRQTGALLVWQLNRKNRELEQASIETVRSVVRLLEERDGFFSGHSARVAALAVKIGKNMKLDEQEIKNLELGGLLHDVGMIGMSESTMTKPDALSEEEYLRIRTHTLSSKEMLKHIIYLQPVIPNVTYHHERYDGGGYPEKLKGKDIPLGSRIIAVAEVYDALINARPYRDKMAEKEAVEHITGQAGKDFDPDVVDAFLKVIKSK